MNSEEVVNREWTVYILRCSDGTLYTGITTDVERRVREHNEVDSKSARYLKTRRPVELVYQESARTRGEAMKRERAIKSLPRVRKLRLIRGD
ncbi:MAG: GIY-YIG nuclease family protein [Anaerolineales bacterium]